MKFIDLATDPLNWARNYSNRGFYMVPLHGLVDGKCTCGKADCTRNAGKHPKESSWPEKATCDYEEIRKRLGPNTNLGIATGHGIVVIDIDGEVGRVSLEQLKTEHEIPDGPIVHTGSGGLHLYFKTPENFGNKVGQILPGIDVRSYGAQVVAPPSMHRSGRSYSWENWEKEIPELPESLADVLRGTSPVNFDVRAWLKRQRPAISGENGNVVFMSTVKQMIRYGVRDLDTFLEVIEDWNEKCDPPWSERELTKGFESAFERFRGEACVDLKRDKNGKVICDRVGLDRIIHKDPRYEYAFKQNSLTKQIHFDGRPIRDVDYTNVEIDICERYDLREVPKKWIVDSIEAKAVKNEFNPIKDYLEGLKWDGVPRLDSLPHERLGAPPDAIYGKYFACFMKAAIRRALDPGCQVDNTLILQGPQGARKSTFFRILTGAEYFVDTAIDLDNKDTYQQTQKAWVVEWSELDVMRKSSNSRIKSFLSSPADTYRPAYGRTVQTIPRAFVIVGTTNHQGILSDPTGDRRYWIIPVGTIDIEFVKANRDQLWAEAYARVKQNELHYLKGADAEEQKKVNENFEQNDETFDMACNALESMITNPEFQGCLEWPHLCDRLMVSSATHGPTKDSLIRALNHKGFRKVRVNNRRAWQLPGFGKPTMAAENEVNTNV